MLDIFTNINNDFILSQFKSLLFEYHLVFWANIGIYHASFIFLDYVKGRNIRKEILFHRDNIFFPAYLICIKMGINSVHLRELTGMPLDGKDLSMLIMIYHLDSWCNWKHF